MLSVGWGKELRTRLQRRMRENRSAGGGAGCAYSRRGKKLDAGNHEAVSVLPEVKPTATQTGLTEGSMCTACNGIIVEQQVIPALRVDHLPDTGDASSVTLWASMLFVGLAGAIAMRKRIDA